MAIWTAPKWAESTEESSGLVSHTRHVGSIKALGRLDEREVELVVDIRQSESVMAHGTEARVERGPAGVSVGDEVIPVNELRPLAALLLEAAELVE